MKKTKKKGFTIVELVIVIAIIAILAAVLIPTFSNIIKKANRSSDTQLIRNLNTAVAIDLSEKGLAKHSTMYDAVQVCAEAGYLPDVIVAKSDYNIAWEQSTGHFVLLDMENGMVMFPTDQYNVAEYSVNSNDNKAEDYFVVAKSSQYVNGAFKDPYDKFSVYAYNDASWPKELTVTKGFDAGSVTTFTKITYTNTKDAQNVVIRTNTFGTKLTVNGTDGDEVTHYGFAGLVEVKKVAMSSYDEYGVVGRETIEEGHLDIKEGATVYQVQQAGVVNSETKTKVSVSAEATVYDVHHEKIDGAIENEYTMFSSSTDTEKIASIGSNVGDTITASACKHENSEDVVDGIHVYEVCKTCGYTLIKVNSVKKTVAVSSETGTENVIMPKASYDGSQVSEGGANGEVTINKNIDGFYVTPSIEATPVVTQDNFVDATHKHEWTIKCNNSGEHVVSCKCGTSYIEFCNQEGKNGVCSKCGYESIFAGGDGTENNPYLIATAKQFIRINDYNNGYYFKLVNDIIFSNEDSYKKNDKAYNCFGYIETITDVTIDGNGKTITSNVKDKFESSDSPYIIVQTKGNCTLKNLTVENGNPIICCIDGDTVFNKVDTIGTKTGADNAAGARYVCFVRDATQNLTFIDCDNYADILCSGYVSAYIGKIIVSASCDITIDMKDCDNYGVIRSTGSGASMILSNAGQTSNTEKKAYINIDNCHNNGIIISKRDYPNLLLSGLGNTYFGSIKPDKKVYMRAIVLNDVSIDCASDSNTRSADMYDAILNGCGTELTGIDVVYGKKNSDLTIKDGKFVLNTVKTAKSYKLMFSFAALGEPYNGASQNYTLTFDTTLPNDIKVGSWINKKDAKGEILTHNEYGTTYYTSGDSYVFYTDTGYIMPKSKPTVNFIAYDENGKILSIQTYKYE